MVVTSYFEVLQAAQKLPQNSQAELAETLLHSLRLMPTNSPPINSALRPLAGMSPRELRVLAKSVVTSHHQQQLQTLLEKNRHGTLSVEEENTLDTLLAEVDSVALLKARAHYTLHLGMKITSQTKNPLTEVS